MRLGRILAVLALAGLSAGCPSDRNPDHARPSIYLIVLDTCRYDALGSYGGPSGITPALDALAADGVRFEKTIAPSPWTLTSIATIVSGHYPTVHGAHGMLQEIQSIRSDVPLAAELFAEAGYQTVAVANAPFVAPDLGFDRGFAVYDFFPSRNVETRRADLSVERLLGHLDKVGEGERVFAMLHLFDPHMAYDPPEETLGRYTSDYKGDLSAPLGGLREIRLGEWVPDPEQTRFMHGLYHEEVAAADHAIGTFIEGLKQRGLYDDALILFTSDHGEEFGDHGGFEHGHSMYQELVQVPLLVKWPAAHSSRQGVVTSQVRHIDLLPTMLAAATLEVPEVLPGRDLLPLVDGENSTSHRPAYSERTHLPPERLGLRDGRWTYLFTPDEDRRELYDTAQDPLEQVDLCAKKQELCARLHEALLDYRDRLEELASSLEEGRPVDLDQDLEDRLRSLGYLGG